MNRKHLFVLALCLQAFFPAFAQELLYPTETNPQLINQISERKSGNLKDQPILSLPIKDDFSYKGIWPDYRIWENDEVFINNSYPSNPVTSGVASFDALNYKGHIHDIALSNPIHFKSDSLFSFPIRLDSLLGQGNDAALSPADSVYLSFFYQPQGLGDSPEPEDSLVLEFFIPNKLDPHNETAGRWIHIWSTEGLSLDDFYDQHQVYFKQVMIPIVDTTFFKNGFRFRFLNYSSLSVPDKTPVNYAGNVDVWHLDYVYLNKDRNKNDVFYKDIAFVNAAQPLLKNYYLMPWYQYTANPLAELRENFNNQITNLDNIGHNYTYRYFIQDENGANIRTYSGGSWNIEPFTQSGYQNYQPHSNPALVNNPLPTAPAEKRGFNIVHVVKEGTTGDDLQTNDTIRFFQSFDNYFAYDDGIAEKGYGLSGVKPRFAYSFTLNRPDTLRAVRIYFNHTLDTLSLKSFKLMVWSSLDPETVIYESELLFPSFEQESIRYQTFVLDGNPLIVNGTFYVGLVQQTTDFLNIGYDVNNNSSSKLFYNTDGVWYPSVFQGALMVRPVLGVEKDNYEQPLSVDQPIGSEKQLKSLLIYPNPSSSLIHIEAPFDNSAQCQIEVFDAFGKLLVIESFSETMDIRNFANGIYIIRLTHLGTGETVVSKMIKTSY